MVSKQTTILLSEDTNIQRKGRNGKMVGGAGTGRSLAAFADMRKCRNLESWREERVIVVGETE